MRVLAWVLLACLSAAAWSLDAPGGLGRASAVLRVDDVRWLEREVVRITAAEGRNPAPLRQAIAIALYRSRSLESIDTSRPAVLAWRSGPSPLLAIIPVTDRRRFLADFGVMPAGEAPLVQVGERDGTVVLSQNHPAGVRDYRLLIANGTAFLARTAEECRALAADQPSMKTTSRSSVSLWSSGSWDAASGLAALVDLPLAVPPCTWLDLAPAGAAIAAVAQEQTDSWRWDFIPMGEGGLQVSVRAQVREDTPLASWLAGQRNQSSRLGRLLRDQRTAALITGAFSWQGQLEAYAAQQLAAQRAGQGAAWGPAADAAWRAWWSLLQRTGDSAWALRVDGPGRFAVAAVMEQPRAAEHLAAWDDLAGACTGIPSSGVGGVRRRAGTLHDLPFSQALMAADRYVLAVEEFGGGEATAELARLGDGVVGAVALEGDPALARLWCDLGVLARGSARLPPDTEPARAVVTAELALRGPLALELRAFLPLRDIAAVVAQLQPTLPGRGERR